jgi:hypothetical protein
MCAVPPTVLGHPETTRLCRHSHTAMQKLRIETSGISGGRSLTRPFRDARRYPSTRV